MFHVDDPKDIKSGKYTEVYFTRAVEVLKAKNIAPSVFRTRWFPLRQIRTAQTRGWIDAHVGVGSGNFFSLSFKIKGSYGIYPPPRPYANMSFDNDPALIFKFRPLTEQDDSQLQEGKGI